MDITYKVVGTNADGSIVVRPADNPYAGQPTAMTAPATGGYPVRINGQVVNFASEADFRMFQAANGGGMPEWNGGGGGGGGGAKFLRGGADAAEAVSGILNARNLANKRQDLLAAIQASNAAKDKIAAQSGGPYGPLVSAILDYITSEQEVQQISLSVLDDEILALDIQAGTGIARVMADFWSGSNPSWGNSNGGAWPAVAAGGVALGVGYLLTRSRGHGGR